MWSSLNLISISKPMDICFVMLQQFSKPEIQNSLKNSNNSLICFIAISVCTFWLCNNLLTKFIVPSPEILTLPSGWRVHICANAQGWAPGMDKKPTSHHRAGIDPIQHLSPRAIIAATAAASASTAAMTTANLGPGSNPGCPLGDPWHPRLPQVHARGPGQWLRH